MHAQRLTDKMSGETIGVDWVSEVSRTLTASWRVIVPCKTQSHTTVHTIILQELKVLSSVDTKCIYRFIREFLNFLHPTSHPG